MKIAKKSKMSPMKSYDSFDAWKRDQSKSDQTLIRELRKIVNGCELPLTESVKWGNGCWSNGDLPVVYLHAKGDAVQLGFFGGSKISDPKKVLEGKSKFVRFITVESKDKIDPKYFAMLVKTAIKVKYK